MIPNSFLESLDRASMSIFDRHRFRANMLIPVALSYSIFFHDCFVNIDSVGCVSALLFLNADIVGDSLNSFQSKYLRHRWAKTLAALIVLALVSVVAVLGIADPAHAAFLSGAETWMATALGVDGDAIAIVFNILRALLVLYIVLALVMVLQKMQQGDDWQTMARIPLMVVGVVFMGDILVGMVIGGGGSETTTPGGGSETTTPE